MKHLKIFEWFNSNNGNNKTRIENEIETAIEEFKNKTSEFANYSENTLRNNLLKKAKENGYRGKIIIRKSHNDPNSKNANKKFIIYEPKNSTLQNIGQIVANER